MRTTTGICFVALAASVVGCATQQSGGLSKPTVVTSPPKYLETVGLGTYTKDDVLSEVGTPDKETNLSGKTHWSYELGKGYGERTYTYIFDDGTLVNVRYNDQGQYNGLTAREVQSSRSE